MLKDAGYPHGESGNWYLPERLGGNFVCSGSFYSPYLSAVDGAAYAPDVAELLNALPIGYQLQRNEKGFFAALPSFWGDTMDGCFFESKTYDNAADALAECCLHSNRKNETSTV